MPIATRPGSCIAFAFVRGAYFSDSADRCEIAGFVVVPGSDTFTTAASITDPPGRVKRDPACDKGGQSGCPRNGESPQDFAIIGSTQTPFLPHRRCRPESPAPRHPPRIPASPASVSLPSRGADALLQSTRRGSLRPVAQSVAESGHQILGLSRRQLSQAVQSI